MKKKDAPNNDLLYPFGQIIKSAILSVRLLTYTTDGTLLENLDWPLGGGTGIAPRSVAVERVEDGQGVLSLVTHSSAYLISIDEGGVIFEEPREFFADVDVETIFSNGGFEGANPVHQKVDGKIILEGGFSVFSNPGTNNSVFDNVVVTSDRAVVYEQDFSTRPLDWQLASEVDRASGNLVGFHSDPNSKEDSTWHNFRLDVDLSIGTRADITIGSLERHSSFSLGLDLLSQRATMRWLFKSPDGGGSLGTTVSEEDIPLVSGLPYRVSMEAIDGRVRAWIACRMVGSGG